MMSGWQKVAAGILLLGALAAGIGIYVNTRGHSIPDGYALETLNGETAYLAQYRGTPLVVNFWATWCPPCRREIPLLNKLQTEHQDLRVVGIAVEEPEPVRQLAAEMAFSYPVLIGEQAAIDLAERLGIEFVGLPYTVLIDARGRVLEIHTGELKPEHLEHVLGLLLP